MPVFKVDVEKQLGTEFWTNVYYVDTPSLTDALLPMADIVVAERNITSNQVMFTKARVSDLVPGTDQFITTPLNQPGNVATEGTLLPLFNVLRVDLGVGVGRPSRKYLRGVLHEAAVNFNTIEAASYASFQTAYADNLELIEELVDVDGQPIIDVTVNNQVGMRQLRRGSRRATQPIIP